MSKRPKKPREKCKTRAWEQDRRNRLNQCFNQLWEVLPIYDKSKPVSKPDILTHATSTIKDLDEKLKNLLINPDTGKATENRLKVSTDVIKKLQDRVKKLLLRNEQLANLLSNAGIKVPSECGTVKKFKKNSKSDNAISPKQATILQKESEKENHEKKPRNRATKSRAKKLCANSKRKSKKQLLSSTNCLFLVSQPSVPNNSCFIISKTPTKLNPTVMTNSLTVKGLIVSPEIKPSIFSAHPQLTGLSRGTLVLSDGTVLPAQRSLPVLPAIIANPVPTHLPTIIVVSSMNNVSSSCASKITVTANNMSEKVPSKSRPLPVLRARPNITKTTQVNKVPIPAFSSKFNKHICLDNKKNPRKKESIVSSGLLKKKTSMEEATKLTASSEAATKTSTSNSDIKSTANVEVVEKPALELHQENNDNNSQALISEISQSINPVVATNKNNSSSDVVDSKKSHDSNATISVSKTTLLTNPPKQAKLDLELNNLLDTTQSSTTEPVKTVCLSKPKVLSEKSSEVVSTSKSISRSIDFGRSKPFEDPNNLTDFKSLEMNLSQTELSNDIFASFNVPPGCQNPESTSPTAAFLLAFPLVSSGTKVAEVIGDENSESQTGTPNLLQIGTMDISKPTQSYSESLTPNILGFDSFSFFNNKENNNCGGYYNNFPATNTETAKTINSFVESGLKSNQPKSVVNVSCNKPPNNNNKIELNKQDSGHNKFLNNYHNNCATAKEQPIAQNIEKTVEINNDIFSFKAISNENYLHNSAKPNNSSMYNSAKSSYITNYPNYKNYSNPSSINSTPSAAFYNTFSSEGNFTSNYSNDYTTDYNRKPGFTNNSCGAKLTHNTQPKIKPPQTNKPINWMTTPNTTASYKTDYFLPPFSNSTTSFSTIPSNSYFNYNSNDHLNTMNHQDIRKASDMALPSYGSYQRTEAEENQFSWSPNKMPQFLETTHAHSFVSSTLPTLVGDLALNNTPVIEQKNAKDRAGGRDNNRRKVGNCESQSSFLSVSQLVEPAQDNNMPAKVSSRRNSGSRSKTNTPKSKRTNNNRADVNKEMQQSKSNNNNNNFNISVATNLFNETKRSNTKHTTSSYSAEALIGNNHQGGSGESPLKRTNNSSCQNKSIVPSFFNENMISYFPSIEVSQENNYIHHSSQTYQSNSFSSQNFTTFQNNTYSSNNYSCPITSSYIPTNNFMPNSNPQDFLGENTNLFQNTNIAKEKCNFTKNYYRPPDKTDKNQTYSCKKAKKRPLNENVLPSFDIHFFSMPGAINSPILPDDFHTTYLPPTTLYSCKNPLYSKPNAEAMPSGLIPPLPAISANKSTIQHPQMSPSVNSAGTSLTNFNLSTIFPEINKGPVQDSFSSNRSKDYNSSSKIISMPPSLQVPFSNKY